VAGGEHGDDHGNRSPDEMERGRGIDAAMVKLAAGTPRGLAAMKIV
jgi:hypothetical protein